MPKATENRKERIELMRKMLDEEFGKTEGSSISYNKFIAKYCLTTGVSKRTAKEYLGLLDDSGEIQIPSIVPIGRETINRPTKK